MIDNIHTEPGAQWNNTIYINKYNISFNLFLITSTTHTHTHNNAHTHANERKCARQVANGPTMQRKPTYLNEFTLSKHNQTSEESRPESNRNEGHHVVSENHFWNQADGMQTHFSFFNSTTITTTIPKTD